MHMKAIVEYALLLTATLSPVLVIVAINVWLAINGEEGTLLLPRVKPYPKVDLEAADDLGPVRSDEPEVEQEMPVEEPLRKAA
jgi:hypothetical protein